MSYVITFDIWQSLYYELMFQFIIVFAYYCMHENILRIIIIDPRGRPTVKYGL